MYLFALVLNFIFSLIWFNLCLYNFECEINKEILKDLSEKLLYSYSNNNQLLLKNSFEKLKMNSKLNKINNIVEEIKNKKIINLSNEEIEDKLNYYKWVKFSNLKELKDKRGIVIDWNSIRELNTDVKSKLNFLSTYCFNNSIILFIIGEDHPTNIDEILNSIRYFNKLNYVTPFNYSKSFFGSPIKLPIGNYNKKSCSVTADQMLIDISNQYGLNIDDMILLFLNKEKIESNFVIKHANLN